MSGPFVFRVRGLLRQPKFLEGSAWLTLQQISVAASVVFLALAAESIGTPVQALWFLLGFVLCMIAPYGFGIMANLRYDQWYLAGLSEFLTVATRHHPFTPRHYPLDGLGEDREAIFSNTAPSVLGEFCSYVMTLLSSTLNATLTLAAVAIVVDWRIGAVYLISFAGCLIFGRMVSERTSTAAFAAEEARVSVAAQGASLWPNLAIGNKQAVANWNRDLTERFVHYTTSFNRSLKIQSWSQFAIALISLLPTSAVLLSVALSAQDDPARLAAILVVAPRVFQILMSLNDLSVAIYDWNHVKGRIEVLRDFFTPPEDTLPPVDVAALTVTETIENHTHLVPDIRQRIARGKPGRVLLSGPNGSGKTTLLLTLKQDLGDAAFFLPCQSGLSLTQNETGSTGEQKRHEIDYLGRLSDPPQVFLLDEWDANLDPHNLAQVDDMIRSLSQTSLVIEVRHIRVSIGSARGHDPAQP
jgi:ABC-type transport system involved in cytochrome bd biosynthesis fused ATPase/permease subunit